MRTILYSHQGHRLCLIGAFVAVMLAVPYFFLQERDVLLRLLVVNDADHFPAGASQARSLLDHFD